MDWQAITLSLRLAACTSLILLVIGLPLAYWLAVTRWRGKIVVESVVALPLVLPPTVLGFYLLLVMSPRGPVGHAYSVVTGGPLPFSFTGILLGSVLFNLPFAVRPFAAAFAGVDRRLVEASWCLGVSRLRTFVWVVLPLAGPGILTGVVLTFAHTMGEFGVVLMVGGNIPGQTRTASVAIYDYVQSPDYEAAGRTALVLLAVSFAALVVTSLVQRRRWAI
jgi:molybdate transport system permease protein